jgi:hypothetical protein
METRDELRRIRDDDPVDQDYFEITVSNFEDFNRRLHRVGVNVGGVEEFSDVLDVAEEEGGMTSEMRNQLRDDMVHMLTYMIKELDKVTSKKGSVVSSQNIMLTEKEFLSEKVPKEVAENIASYLTAKKGSIGAQASQVRTSYGKAGVPNRGGRKTKKNKSSKRKTHGRRV